MTRFARPLILLAVLLVLKFALPRLLHGDPTGYLQSGGGQDTPVMVSPEARARLRQYYGLDRPLPEQFGHYLLATARGDLGFSIHPRVPGARRPGGPQLGQHDPSRRGLRADLRRWRLALVVGATGRHDWAARLRARPDRLGTG